MKKSAMMLAFQAFKRKPMALLLLLPVPVVSVLVSAISLQAMPDLSKLMDMNYLMEYAGSMESTQSIMLTNIISMLVSSVSLLLSLASAFLLVPPAMELLRDGVAGQETAPGWYMRGLRSHWWKPIVDSVFTTGIFIVLFIPLYIIFIIIMSVVMSGLTMNLISSAGDITNFNSFNGLLTGILAPIMVMALIFGAIVYVLQWIINSVFGMFLPALADRSFGETFKLMFSKKGFRKLPRMMGGQLLIALVPGVFFLLLMTVYLLITGLPNEPTGFMITVLNFMKSWAGILGLLVVSVFSILIYPFRFGVHQLVKQEEAAELIQ